MRIQRVGQAETFENPLGGALEFERAERELREALKKKLAAEGDLGLPPALEKKRQEHLIPGGAFKVRPVYDRIYVYQIGDRDIPEGESATYGDTKIIMPETAKEFRRGQVPRGVLVGAGLQAMNKLWSNGIEIGDTVWIIRNAPWGMPIDWVGPHELSVMVMRAGDVTGSEEGKARVESGELQVVRRPVERDGLTYHVHAFYDTKNECYRYPDIPWMGDDL